MATGELAVLDRTGDTKVIWDAAVPEEVAAAKATFDALKKKGYAAFSVKRDGEKGTKIAEFDASAEKLIMVPQIAGG